jgi:hypothetical protein
MLSSHAKFDENGFGMLIRDLENLYLYVGGSNDIRQDAQQSVTQDNSSPLSTAPLQLTGFDGIGGTGSLSQPQSSTLVAAAVPYPISVTNGGTNSTTALSGSSIMVSNGTRVVQGAAGTATTVLHGNPSGTPSYGAVSLTADVSGILPAANGGTNSNVPLSGSSIMVANSGNIVQGAAGTATTVLHGNAAGTPTYSAVSLTADVSGVLPIASGGTAGFTQASAQSGLGLGTMCTQNANAVSITGGTITDAVQNSLYYRNIARFKTNGTLTIPAGVYTVFMCVTAGGGGGAGASTVVAAPTVNLAGSGGGGGEAIWGFVDVSPGQVLTVTVGAGGSAGGAGSGTSGAGGASSVTGSGPTVSVSAVGGSACTGPSGSPNPGIGGNRFTGSCPTGMFSSPGHNGAAGTLLSWTTSGTGLASLTFAGGQGGQPGADPGVFWTGPTVQGTGSGGSGGQSGSAGGAGQPGGVAICY